MTRTSLPRMLKFFPAELALRDPDSLTFCCAVCGILAVERGQALPLDVSPARPEDVPAVGLGVPRA